VKVIDFGSSCFTTDSLSSYVQSRCYRAPEVVLGLKYDGRIDVWSLGAILPELVSGNVLFQADSAAAMLARMAAILGPFPASMLHGGRHTCRFVSKHGVFYETEAETGRIMYHFPRRTELKRFLGTEDPLFFDFITRCLTLDPAQRPTAAELLQHPFILAQD
jgi:serine/threonine protein kinase